MSNKELTEELHQLIIRKFKKRQVHSSFIDNIWCTDLAHLQLKGKFNKGNCFLLCFIDIFSKHGWVIPFKDIITITITITNALQKILDQSNCKPNKIWVVKGNEFCNR